MYCKNNNINVVSGETHFNKQALNDGIEDQEFKFEDNTGTVSEWFKYWYMKYRYESIREVTRQKYRITYSNLVNHGIGKVKLIDLKREDVQEYANWYGKDHSKITAYDEMQKVRSSLNDAMIDGKIKINPAANIKISYKEQIMTFEEQKELRDKKKWLEVDEYMKFKYSLLFKLKDDFKINEIKYQILDMSIFIALKTGARISEILGITKNDIDYQKAEINIDKTWDYKKYSSHGFEKTKNNASVRVVPVDQETIDILSEYVNWLDSNNIETEKNTLFILKGKSFYNSTINNRMKTLLNEIAIEPISIHKLRHTQASLLISKEVPLQVIAKRLGHTDTSMIQRVYGHLLQETENRGNRMILDSI
nr:site-specific integrase [Vagococcus fluvialis]